MQLGMVVEGVKRAMSMCNIVNATCRKTRGAAPFWNSRQWMMCMPSDICMYSMYNIYMYVCMVRVCVH